MLPSRHLAVVGTERMAAGKLKPHFSTKTKKKDMENVAKESHRASSR
jgi:3-hydroxyisobutyrate dehydrogenase-like beta-hydroxyacid dehydrogenase